MTVKWFSLLFICLLTLTVNAPFISGQTDNAAKIKADILKRGTGENRRVKVKTLSGTEVKGYISRAGNDSFDLTDSKTKQVSTFAYGDVAQVKNSGSKALTIGVVAGLAAAGAIALGLFLARCRNEGGCGGN